MPTPPAVDRSLLQNLAGLARLHIQAERQAPLLQRLQRIVEAFEALHDLPTEVAPPSPSSRSLPLRQDRVEAPLPVEQVLANAPRSAAGAFVVPRVVDA